MRPTLIAFVALIASVAFPQSPAVQVNHASSGGGFSSDPTKNGMWYPQGITSGGVAFSVANIAGTAVTLIWPTDSATATNDYALKIGAAATCPTGLPATAPTTCRFLAWGAAGGGGATLSGVSEFSTGIAPTGVADITGGSVTQGFGYPFYAKNSGTLLSFSTRTGTVTGGTAYIYAIYNGACTSLLGYARSTTMTSNATPTVSVVSSFSLTAGTKYNLVLFTDATTFESLSMQGVSGWAFAASPNFFKTGNSYTGTGGSMTPPAACGTNTTVTFLPTPSPIFNY